MAFGFSFGGLIFLLALLVITAFRVLREYERGVVFMLGRFWKVKGPGLVLIIPVVQQMVRVDLRTVVMDVPPQDVISHDNVSVKVNAVVYFRVVDPERAIIQVANFLEATSQLAQTTLRAVLGKHELDEMLAERERLNLDIQKVLDAQTDRIFAAFHTHHLEAVSRHTFDPIPPIEWTSTATTDKSPSGEQTEE